MRSLLTLLLAIALLSITPTLSSCSEVEAQTPQTNDNEGIRRSLLLRDVPGRHVRAWDAMFTQDVERARVLLSDHITEDATVTFLIPDAFGGDQTFAPGIEGWIGLVTSSGQAGGWVPAGPGNPSALHVIGSIYVVEESPSEAILAAYVRASHYKDSSDVDISEALLEFDVIYDESRATWLVAHLDLTPLSLRNEGGLALPPVSAPAGMEGTRP